jgi:DNA-binding SARP family transcriptional activator
MLRMSTSAATRTQEAAAPTRGDAPALRLLDGFELSLAGDRLELPLPAQRLLGFLALHDQPLLRGYVGGTLWLDSNDEHAAGSLRSALWRVRQLDVRLVEASGSRLELSATVEVDVRSAVAWGRSMLDPARELRDGDTAPIWRPGELLPDWYDDWVAIERERLRALRTHALEALCERLTAAGRYGEATEAGLAAIRDEPLRESAHRALIGVHLAEGNRAAALQQYQSFARLLQSKLHLRPSRRMEQLLVAMMSG